MQTKQYSWNQGFNIKADPQLAGPELERILEHGGSAADVLAAAEDPTSPLHPAFEWNDSEAARLHRLETARYLIRSIRVTVKIEQQEPRTVRVLTALKAAPAELRYQRVEDIISDPLKRRAKLNEIRGELQSFKRRYAEFSDWAELRALFEAIAQFDTAIAAE